jgi:hypothetical protein
MPNSSFVCLVFQDRIMAPKKVCILGSGNWGSTIACLVGENANKFPDLFVSQVTGPLGSIT